jgi:DUF4097 and DUF4098 domain-containing protein YvlB
MVDRVRVTATSGDVRLTAEERDDVAVSGAQSSGSGSEVVVTGDSDNVDVRVPVGVDLVVGNRSGDVTLNGTLGTVSVTTSSGDVEAEDVASIDARTVSGKLRVKTSRGSLRLKTKSARVRVGRADGAVHVAAGSGRVEIDDARGEVTVKTVSGNIDVLLAGRAPVTVETVSGKIKLRVGDDLHPEVRLRTMSGKKRIECATGDDFVLDARSISGNITVAGA